jgi:phospholipid/cholesterol/gamma-HCH transport system substrate-binding protein
VAKRSAGPTTFGSGLKLGVFAVITSLALVLLTDALGGISLPWASGYTAMFTDATGLLPGDDVRIAGAKVGEVDDVELQQGDPPLAKVTFDLDSDRTVPASVHATIRYRNMVGQRYVALTQSADGEKVSDRDLKPGDIIGVRQTDPALDLTVLLNGFKPLFAALSPKEVNDLSYEIVQTLQGEGDTVEGLLSHTASLTSTLAKHDKTIGSVIKNLNTVLSTMADRHEELDTSIGRLQDFVSGLSKDRTALGDAISSIGTLSTQTADLVSRSRPAINADVDSLDTLATTLNANSKYIETALERLPDTYQALASTGAHGSWFSQYVCDLDGSIGLGDGTAINPVKVHSPKARCQVDGE